MKFFYIVVTPLAYALLFILSIVDSVFARIDRSFHTRITAPKISREEVEQVIRMQLPIGSSLKNALAFIDEQNYERIYGIFTDSTYWDERSGSDSYRLAEHRHAIRRMVMAWIRRNGGFLIKWETRICLYFDENDQLLTYLIDQFGIGL